MTDLASPTPGSSERQAATQASAGRRGSRTFYVAVGALILLGLLGSIFWKLSRAVPANYYVTSAATLGRVTRMVSTTGTVNPELTIIVGSYVSGIIKDMFCDYNTQVKTGQVCAGRPDRFNT